MKKLQHDLTVFILFSFGLLTMPLKAQTDVYLRSSGPAAVPVCGASNATPVVVQTCSAHNISGPTATVVIDGVCSGPGYASPINGIRVATVVDATHVSLSDLSNNPIAANGPYVANCGSAQNNPAGAQWMGVLTRYTLGSQPLGSIDGPSGTILHRVALGTSNGLASLTVSGCPSCVITVTTAGYDPTAGSIPVAAGNKFSITGTTSSKLNTAIYTGGAPYTVANLSSTGWTSTVVSGLTNGNYTTNNACGPASPPNDSIGGTQNCVRVSQVAYPGNPFWDGLITDAAILGGSGYKFVFDGGAVYTQPQMEVYTLATFEFLVDPANSQALAASTYALNRAERAGGVNWTGNETATQGGTNGLNQYAGSTYANLAFIYSIVNSYLAPGEKTAFLNKIYNDLDDPSIPPCSKANVDMSTGHNQVLASGTAQAGSGSTITLAASDTQPDSYYVNTVIQATISGGKYSCLVTSYMSATKVATCSAAWGSAPASGTPYSIYGTITTSSNMPGTAATITGVHSTFTQSLNVGDAIIGANGWDSNGMQVESYVTAIQSDTSLTAINNLYTDTSTTVPQMAWYIPQWHTGDCGLSWLSKHWYGAMGAQPNLYPSGGGTLTANVAGRVADGGNNGNEWTTGHMLMGFVAAPDDPRAVRDLAFYESFAWDYELRHYWNYVTGFAHSGSVYNTETVLGQIQSTSQILSLSVPGFPDMNLNGQWNQNIALMRVFQIYPDFRANGGNTYGWPVREGGENGSNTVVERGGMSSGYATDSNFFMNPTAPATRYLRCWVDSACNTNIAPSLWGFWGVTSAGEVGPLLHNDPRIQPLDYTTQPHQYLFQATNAATCASLTGWPCPANFRGDVVISRGGPWAKTDTFLYYGSRVYWSDHDVPENGTLRIYKVGELIGTDSNPPNDAGSGVTNESVVGDMFQFGGSGSAQPGQQTGVYGASPIVRWASANHGSWNAAYGDKDSQYSYLCSDLSQAYTTRINYFLRCIFHMKPTGGEEIIAQLDTIATPSPTQMVAHIHYQQNGETGISAYKEGTTTCPGGCAALNANRAVQSMETGVADGNAKDPTPNFGVISTFLSPGTITVNWDCPGNAECSPSSTYPGGAGHTDRVSICGGTSCGSSVSSYTALTVHKIAQSLSDTTLTATALQPDANWFGVQTADKVILGALGGTTQSAIASFRTTHSGTAQYIFGGLTPGSYTVTVDNRPVVGSPFTVSANDNSLEFMSTPGMVSVNGGVAAVFPSTSVSGQASAAGDVIVR